MNPIQLDPTRTSLLRNKFASVITQPFVKLKGRINQAIWKEDSLGLREFTFNAQSWRYMSNDAKIEQFRQWLLGQVAVDQLRTDTGNIVWEEYIRQAHAKGMDRAYNDLRKYGSQAKPDFYRGSKTEFLRSSFLRPVAVERVKVLVKRAALDYKGITDAMEQQVTRTLVDGLIQGVGPRDLAKRLNERVDKIGITRAQTLARTEIIRAHAEGQLDSFEALGVSKIGVQVEFKAALHRACPQCQALNGIVIDIKKARGMIPVHARCRCAFIPANIGEKDEGQIRDRKRIQSAIRRSKQLAK